MAFFAGVAKNERVFMSRLVAHMTGAPDHGRFSYVGTGNGELVGLYLPVNMYDSLIEIECSVVSSGEAEFTVLVDAVPTLSAVTNKPYESNGLSFCITLGTTDYVVGDKFTIAAQGNYSFTNYDAVTKPALIHYMGLPDGVEEDLTLTCTTEHNDVQDGIFSVTGSVTGAMGSLTVGELFESNQCNIHLPRPIWLSSSDSYLVGDTITIPLREGVLKNSVAKYQYMAAEYAEQETFTGEQPTIMLVNAAFRGSGNGGTETFYFSIERGFYYARTVYWGFSGYTGYDQALPFNNQPGYISDGQKPYISTSVDEITFWVSVTGRRVAGVIMVGTVYEHFYLGLLQPHQAPDYYPNPLAVGGTMTKSFIDTYGDEGSGAWEVENAAHHAYFNPRLNREDIPNVGPLAVYDPDGNVVYPALGAERVDGNPVGKVDRLSDVTHMVSPYNFFGLARLNVNFDGTYTPVPVWVSGRSLGQKSVLGRFDGLVGLSGVNQSAENLLTYDNRYFIVFNNVYRTGLNDFCALEVK